MDFSLDYYSKLKNESQLRNKVKKFCCDVLINNYIKTKGDRVDKVLKKKIKALKNKKRYIEMKEV